MNTKFNYLYRDACNYKNHGEVIFSGCDWVVDDSLQTLLDCLDEGQYFIAHQVGIPEVFFDYGELSAEDDHCWHEFNMVENTDEEPTDPRTWEEFIEDVKKAHSEGWKEFNNHLGTHL